MSDQLSFIDIRQISLNPNIARKPIDPFDVIAYFHVEMGNPENIRPLVVRTKESGGKYVVVCERAAYDWEELHLKAARKCGLSGLPCRIIDACPQNANPSNPGATSPPFHTPPPIVTPAKAILVILRWARELSQRSKPGTSRVSATELS